MLGTECPHKDCYNLTYDGDFCGSCLNKMESELSEETQENKVTNIVRFIGDVHGHLDTYRDIIYGCEYSVALGEMGFNLTPLISHYAHDRIDGDKHIIIPGNHDAYNIIQCITTFLCNPGYGPLDLGSLGRWYTAWYVRGAHSIDKNLRVQGIDWFPEEELSYQELMIAIDMYAEDKPDIMVTHTCPNFLVPELIPSNRKVNAAKTELALERMWKIHAPKIWIFGHFHKNYTQTYKGKDGVTSFIGLDELSYLDFNTETLTWTGPFG